MEFPESLDPEVVAALNQLPLGSATADAANGAMDADDAEECHMKPVGNFEEEVKHRARLARNASSNAYDSDDEDDLPRGQRVQCAQQ